MRVEIQRLAKSFPSTGDVLVDLDLTVASGEFVSVVGPSGCGKSTLLRLLAGLESPNAGRIAFDGAASAPAVGYVFQEPRLLPWRRAWANVALPLELAGVARAERRRAAAAALALVGLADAAHVYPDELSGGMRMRASVARALVNAPSLLLLDEPFGALDEMTRQALNNELMALWRDRQWTALFVTHNVFEAVYLSQRIIVLGVQPGGVLAAIDVPFSFPREASLRAEPAFAALVGEVLQALEGGACV
jgi:NitT/TauT family transport system ATP-binding protein